MKKINWLNAIACYFVIVLACGTIFPQKRAAKVVVKPNPIVFAVLDNGQTVEPIGEIDKNELIATKSGEDDRKSLTNFTNSYYKPKTVYNLIFGGAASGIVTIANYDVKSDCAKNLASVTTVSAKAKLNNFVMALATNAPTPKTTSAVRRLPSAAERAEIEALVRAEFVKQSVAAKAVKNLHYYNLTALDVNNDGKAEMVGSFWVESSAKERNLLFFIAEKGTSNKYQFSFSDYKKVTPDEMMSGDLKDLDNGVGNELLLDALDYNGDKTAEIFTISRAFEGNNFYVYRHGDGKWTRIFENYNYHCAY